MMAAMTPARHTPASTGCRKVVDITMNTFSVSVPVRVCGNNSRPVSPTITAATSTTITQTIATRRAVVMWATDLAAMKRARMCGCPA